MSKEGSIEVKNANIKSQLEEICKTSKLDLVEKWLSAMTPAGSRDKQKIESYRKTIQKFIDFSGKSAQELFVECSNVSEKQLRNHYAQLLLSYTAYLQKSLPPNDVRQQINVVRSFFSYYKIPIGFGVCAHLQFFLK